MVEVIVNEIGKQLKEANTYFNSYGVNVIQMPNGQIVRNFYGDEPETSGLTDCQGIAFYIRIEPKATLAKAPKRFDSCEQNYLAKQRCHLVAFAFESQKEIDSQKWVEQLTASLLSSDLNKLSNKPAIEIAERNADHIENFFEETKKQFNVEKRFNCVKISFDIIYTVELKDCNICDIYKAECADEAN